MSDDDAPRPRDRGLWWRILVTLAVAALGLAAWFVGRGLGGR